MRVSVRGSLFTHCTVTCSFLVKKEMKDLKYPLKFGGAGSSSNPFSTRRTVRSLKASLTPVPGFRTRSQTESPVWRVTLRTSDSSEALERWSLIKTSLQSELVHTPPPPHLHPSITWARSADESSVQTPEVLPPQGVNIPNCRKPFKRLVHQLPLGVSRPGPDPPRDWK